jgi:hypothetical protein
VRISSRTIIAALLLLAPLSVAPGLAATAAAQAGEVLTNESVVQMINGKVPKDLIVTKIRTTKSTFDVTSAGLISLNTSKIPSDIIKMMMNAAAGTSGRDAREALTNDAVIRMVSGQLSKDIIVTKIQMSRPDFDLTTSGIINLNQSKVSQDVVKAMMAASSSPAAPPPAPPGKKPVAR